MNDPLAPLNLQTAALRAEMTELGRLADSFGARLVTAFASAIVHGRKLSDVLRGLALSLAQTALTAALKPLAGLAGGLLSGLMPSARGNVFQAGRPMPFASGGILNGPVLFPLTRGLGLAGEAGPEAILPLARGRDGKLGIRSQGGGVSVTVNIATQDVASFSHSQSQVAALIARAVARGQRNL